MTKNIIRNFPHARNFGLELEFFNVTRARAAEALRAPGVQFWDAHYQSSGTGWKIYDDGSINGRNSIELVSPILSGRDGLREVAKVVKQFALAGARVNKSCGFHVHVDARDLAGIHLKNVYRRYAAHEAKIDAFMVPSRRASVNEYCRSASSAINLLREISDNANARTVASTMCREIEILNSDGSYNYVGGRYNKVNLTAFLRHGTIEFRQHSGTMNVEKVINWIVFCVNFVNTSMDNDTADIYTGLHSECVDYYTSRTTAFAMNEQTV